MRRRRQVQPRPLRARWVRNWRHRTRQWRRDRCSFEPIYFDFNENVLSTEATSAIDRDVECVKKMKNPALVLTGHSDPRGTEEYNLALSDRRAQAVRDRLQRIGANPASVRLVPKGELEATGTDESGWAKDRRVDFTTK